MQYYAAKKTKETLAFVLTCMGLESIMLNKISQAARARGRSTMAGRDLIRPRASCQSRELRGMALPLAEQ